MDAETLKARLKIAGLLAVAAILLAASGCTFPPAGVKVGRLQTESRTVDLGGATSVSVEIFMGAGELEVSGGAEELLEADFTYNVEELKPEVSYSGSRLIVSTPDVKVGLGSLWDVDDYRYEWDLSLNDDVAMEMDVDVGAGRADLLLGSMSLTSLDIDTGAGDVTVDVSGSSTLTRLNLDMGAGKVTADLTGDWQGDLDATFQGGVGDLTVRLPRTVGVRVQVGGGVGKVDATGLSRDGDTYTNDAYRESEVTLRIEIEGGVGRINLQG
jgi:hypothetical protein